VKVIIAGSRDIDDFRWVKPAVIASGFLIDEVVSGGARGVDKLGERYSREELGKEPKVMAADWDRYGSRGPNHAGNVRNRQMGDYAEALLALTMGTSGTADMIKYMKSLGKSVAVLDLRPGPEHPMFVHTNGQIVPFFEIPQVRQYLWPMP
jgi:hypothetical protein